MGQQHKQQHNGSKQQGRTTPPSGTTECHRCGGRYSASGCLCREFVCHFCKKKGHLAKVCRRKNRYRTEQANAVTAEESITESHQSEEYTLFQVRAGPSRPYKAVVKANGNLLPMEIDTGASVSVVGEKTLKTIQKGETTLELQQTSVRLQTYTGETISVLGSVVVPLEHNGQTRTLPLIVTEGSGPSLLGRDWLSALRLDWKAIFSVEATLSLQQILDKYSDVFEEGLGELREVTRTNAHDFSNRVRFPSRSDRRWRRSWSACKHLVLSSQCNSQTIFEPWGISAQAQRAVFKTSQCGYSLL